MKKQFRLLMAALLLSGVMASCSQSDVDDLTIDDAKTETYDRDTGGGPGGGPIGGE